jgi:hypothetical protein
MKHQPLEVATMRDAELSLALRGMDSVNHNSSVLGEAAARLAHYAAESGQYTLIMVEAPRVEFPRTTPSTFRMGSSAPLIREHIVVDGLARGEFRAVDLYGDIVIVKRQDIGDRS